MATYQIPGNQQDPAGDWEALIVCPSLHDDMLPKSSLGYSHATLAAVPQENPTKSAVHDEGVYRDCLMRLVQANLTTIIQISMG